MKSQPGLRARNCKSAFVDLRFRSPGGTWNRKTAIVDLRFHNASWPVLLVDKLDALGYPKGISYRPVLIHVNGVTPDVVDSDHFAAVVDASDLLHPRKGQGSLF